MDQFELSVAPRSIAGKRVKTLRRGGMTPANLYGHNVESQALQVDTVEMTHALRTLGRNAIISLRIEGDKRSRPVVIRGVQRDPVYHKLLHVDFYQVSLAEKMRAAVRLVLTGKAPAVDDFGGILIQSLENVSVEALPADIPSHIEVDVSVLAALDASVHVRDLVVDEKVHVLTDGDSAVARIASPRAGVEAALAEEEAAAAAAEPEVEEVREAAAPAEEAVPTE